jgi:hypothetical protein
VMRCAAEGAGETYRKMSLLHPTFTSPHPLGLTHDALHLAPAVFASVWWCIS